MLLLMGWEWKIRLCRYLGYSYLIVYTMRLKGAFSTIFFSLKGLTARIVSRYDLITLACELRAALVTVATRT